MQVSMQKEATLISLEAGVNDVVTDSAQLKEIVDGR
jgi:hypothetical protein